MYLRAVLFDLDDTLHDKSANLRAFAAAQYGRSGLQALGVAAQQWEVQYESTRGSRTRFEELAYQRWLDQRIVEEKFFYDPSQFKSATD